MLSYRALILLLRPHAVLRAYRYFAPIEHKAACPKYLNQFALLLRILHRRHHESQGNMFDCHLQSYAGMSQLDAYAIRIRGKGWASPLDLIYSSRSSIYISFQRCALPYDLNNFLSCLSRLRLLMRFRSAS